MGEKRGKERVLESRVEVYIYVYIYFIYIYMKIA
jgi:hypothetical protein